jgi:uncharacterized repeat protein (TIGR01451 family)
VVAGLQRQLHLGWVERGQVFPVGIGWRHAGDSQVGAPDMSMSSPLVLSPTALLCGILLPLTAAFAQTTTSTSLAASPNPATLGQAVTLTATVTAGAIGNVTFFDGTTPLGTAGLSSGKATLTTRLLPAGTRSLTATYGGDTAHAASSSSTFSQLVIAVAASRFLSALTFPTGAGPTAVAVGDLNGDGKADLVAANSVDGTVSVLLGNGDGSFAPKLDFPAGAGPVTVAIADFNNDGKPDVAVGSQTANTLSILLGNGDGTLQAPVSYAAGPTPSDLTAADFNRDGKVDLVMQSDSRVALYRGNGDGTFQAPVTIAGPLTSGMSVGDFNGDGKADLVYTTYISIGHSSTSYFNAQLGNGDGTFQTPVSQTVGLPYTMFAAADLNGDGNADLVAIYAYIGSLVVMLGNGHGSFQPPVQYGASSQTQAVTVADIDGDGRTDVITADKTNSVVAILFGNGNGTLQTPPLSYAVGAQPYAVVAGDFNGDGRTDLVTVNYGSSNVSVLLGTVAASLGVASTHAHTFYPGQTGATYTLTVSNKGTVATTGTITLTDTLPAGMVATGMAGDGWSCTAASLTCTRSDSLAAGASYPAVTLTVNIGQAAPVSSSNQVTVSGGNTLGAYASDPTCVSIVQPVSVTPSAGSGTYQTFTVSVLDISGYSAIGSVVLLVNQALTGTAGCFITISIPSYTVYLLNDAGSTWLSSQPWSNGGLLSNGQCTINARALSASHTANTLTLQIPLIFKPAFAGPKTVWAAASEVSTGLSSGFQPLGSWSVIPAPRSAQTVGVFNPAQRVFLLDANGNFAWDGAPPDRYFSFGTTTPGQSPQFVVVTGDWNGSGTKKIGLFDTTTAQWILDYDGDGVFTFGRDIYTPWGSPGDIPVVGDWDGSGTDKIGVFSPNSAQWLLDYNGNYNWDGPGLDKYFLWGSAGDTPVVGDWNGSGTAKVATFGPKTGLWVLDYNGDFLWNGAGVDKYFPWGSPGDIPVVGDWNGSGTAKVGTFGPKTGLWLLDYNGNFSWDGPSVDKYFPWGSGGDTPVIGDWNGSGTSKVGTFGPGTALWLLDYNGNFVWDGPSVDKYLPWGSPGDAPVILK